MTNKQIGIFNNNWKGGHRRDEFDSVSTMSERELLVIARDVTLRVLSSIPDGQFETFREKMTAKLAQDEQALADYDAQSEAVNTTASPLNKVAVFDVSKNFSGIPATASAEWVRRHLNGS